MNKLFNTVMTFLFAVATLLSAQAHADAQLLFIHTDHLGTPQVMTDSSQNVVWKRTQTPFGETISTNTQAVSSPRR